MNIDVNSKVTTTSNVSTTTSSKNQTDDSVKFSDELSNLSAKELQEEEGTQKTDSTEETEKTEEAEKSEKTEKTEAKEDTEEVSEEEESENINGNKDNIDIKDSNKEIGEVIDGLEDVVAEINDKINKPENKKEDNNLINNDVNIQEQKDLQMFQMNANMNFNSDGQPFAGFMNNNQNDQKLSSSAKDLEEESAILSTMSENIAMANRNRVLNNENETQNNQNRVKTVSNSEGIKKVDKQSNVTVETVVKYDSIIMNESDVDFFAKLVENGQTDMTQAAQKSSKVSKTLADMLAKSMKDNQPVRIDFDNNISVIIKIGRDGKISADFLPSSQVAEAYLKENLPLLRQRFEDNNIEYDELNQRQRKQDDKENRKKEQKDE